MSEDNKDKQAKRAQIQLSSTSFSEDYGSLSIEIRNIKTADTLMFLLALNEWLEDVAAELNGELPEPGAQTTEENAVVHDPANQQESEEQEPPRQKRKYTKRQPSTPKTEPEAPSKQVEIPNIALTTPATKPEEPPFEVAPASSTPDTTPPTANKQPTAEDLAIAAKVEEEFVAADKVMENFEMHLANIRSDFAVSDAVSVWLKIEPDFKKINASDTVIGIAQDSLVRTVEGLLKISYDNARSLVGSAVKKERERRAAAPIDVIAEPVVDDAEAKFCADLSKQTSLAAAVKSVIQHGFPGANTVKISDALALVLKYKTISPVLAQSNDNALRTVIPTLARQLGIAPTA